MTRRHARNHPAMSFGFSACGWDTSSVRCEVSQPPSRGERQAVFSSRTDTPVPVWNGSAV